MKQEFSKLSFLVEDFADLAQQIENAVETGLKFEQVMVNGCSVDGDNGEAVVLFSREVPTS